MPLESLVEHSTVQTEAIDRYLSEVGPMCPSSLSVWDAFRSSIWKRGLEFLQKEELVERDEKPIDDIHALLDPLPLTRSTLTLSAALPESWRPLCRRILVRSEYYETEQAVLWNNKDEANAFVVAGQSGIGSPPLTPLLTAPNLRLGKSAFLLWLLMRRLALGLPTILQTHKGYAILFHEGGTFRFDDLDNPKVYNALEFSRRAGDAHKRIWAFIDTGPLLPEPGEMFKNPETFFVVTATHRSNPEWFGKVDYAEFFMKPWSFSEIIQVYVDQIPEASKTHPLQSRTYQKRTPLRRAATLALPQPVRPISGGFSQIRA